MEFIGDLDGTVSLNLCWGRVQGQSGFGQREEAQGPAAQRGSVAGAVSGRRWQNRILGSTPDLPSQNARLNKMPRESA